MTTDTTTPAETTRPRLQDAPWPTIPAPTAAAAPLSASFTVPLPEQLRQGPPEDVLMEYDLIQHVSDVAASRAAVDQLRTLMSAAHDGGMGGETHLLGMSVLLEGIHGRLDMALSGLVSASRKLGFDSVAAAPGVRP